MRQREYFPSSIEMSRICRTFVLRNVRYPYFPIDKRAQCDIFLLNLNSALDCYEVMNELYSGLHIYDIS